MNLEIRSPPVYKKGEYVVVFEGKKYSKGLIIKVYPVNNEGQRFYRIHYVVCSYLLIFFSLKFNYLLFQYKQYLLFFEKGLETKIR